MNVSGLPSEPTTYPPEFYAALHTGTPGDVLFYQRWCDPSSRILELGSGYGRILVALARPGRELVGLEREPGMMPLAAERIAALPENVAAGVSLVPGDMRSFGFGTRFDRILLPHSGLFCLRDEQSVLACFTRVAEHLEPDGLFIGDTYCADGFHADASREDGADEDVVPLTRIEVEGRSYDVFEHSRWIPHRQRIEVTYIHRPVEGGPPVEARIEHRYWLAPQLESLIEAAGLELLRLDGDFEGTPFDEDSEIMVFVARRKPTKRRR